jgi:hypothetical protein
MFCMITNIYNKKTKGRTLMEFFTATEELKKFFFFLLEMFAVCTTGGTAHIDTIFRFLLHTCQHVDVCVAQLVKKSHTFHGIKASQEPITCLNPKPGKSRPCPTIICLLWSILILYQWHVTLSVVNHSFTFSLALNWKSWYAVFYAAFMCHNVDTWK